MIGNIKNATIIDIAKQANVTNITVSRAFNKPELVKKETREKILKIAKELNYLPNVFAQNLKNNQSKIIGFVSDSTFNPVYGVILTRLCKMADKRGYTVMIFETGGSKSAESRAVMTLLSHKAEGILLSVVSDREDYQPDYLTLAKAYQIPLVLFDRDIPGADLPGVFLNNVEMGVLCGKRLIKSSYSNYLICSGPENSDVSQDRISGFLGGLRVTDQEINIINSSYSFESAYPCIYSYIKELKELPDCIIGINGVISMAIIKVFTELNINNVDLFSFDEVPYADIYGRKVPCIFHRPNDWAKEVGDLMFDILDGKEPRHNRVHINSFLRE